MHKNFTNMEFIGYLEMVADDLRESGNEATADDYDECAARIMSLLDSVIDMADFVADLRRRTI